VDDERRIRIGRLDIALMVAEELLMVEALLLLLLLSSIQARMVFQSLDVWVFDPSFRAR
jgi:hypothetical protein